MSDGGDKIEPARRAPSLALMTPDVEVVSPVHEIVQDSFDIIRHELKGMKKLQRAGATLDPQETMRLQRLMNSLARAHRAQLDALESEDLGKLDRAELLAELRKELGSDGTLPPATE